jgi:hypothetical protein
VAHRQFEIYGELVFPWRWPDASPHFSRRFRLINVVLPQS